MSVKPLKRGFTERPTYFVIRDEILTPQGELYPRTELHGLFAGQTEIGRWVTRDSGHLVSELDQVFHDTPRWNFTATDVPVRQGYDSKGRERIIVMSRAYRAGWRAGDKSNGDCAPSRYHEIIDVDFLLTAHPMHEFTLTEIVERFRDVEDFCRTWNLPLATSKGKLGRDLLRHPMFFKRERRKVPRATNDNVRKYGLDGNHYSIPDGAAIGLKHDTVVQYDMTKAHPTVVAENLVTLPDSDGFYARGYYHEAMERKEFIPWILPGTNKYKRVTDSYLGAYIVCIDDVDLEDGWHISQNLDLAPSWIRNPRDSKRFIGKANDGLVLFVGHNEFHLLERYGCSVRFIAGGWLSSVPDREMVRLSRWIIEQLESASDLRKSWLKPALLAVYGGLATTPSRQSFSFAHAIKGKPAPITLSHRLPPVDGFRTGTSKLTEPATNHVMQRALIESQTTLETLETAVLLRRSGFAPIHIYADCVYALPPRDWNGQAPELPGWKVAIHTNFTSVHSHAVRSDQEVKLPGIAHQDRALADARGKFRPRRNVFALPRSALMC